MKRKEYLDENPSRKKKKKKKKHKLYAFVVLLFGFAIIALTLFIVFHIQKIEVKGNKYCSTEEIAKTVQNDQYSVNSLYVLGKYALGYGKELPCLDSMKISMSRPWVLKVTVKEKPIVGYMQDGKGTYYFFDKEGLVVLTSTMAMDGIPLVEGMDVDTLELYKKMKSQNSRIFTEILETSQEMQKYKLSVDKIVCKKDRIYVYIANVCVSLGKNVTSEKIAQLPVIIEKLEGKEGTLHLENFSDGRKTITFDIGEFPE